MCHVGQEFGFTTVCKFGNSPGGNVLLDAVSEIENRLIDLGLQAVHLTASLDGDGAREITAHRGGRHLGGDFRDGAHLIR